MDLSVSNREKFTSDLADGLWNAGLLSKGRLLKAVLHPTQDHQVSALPDSTLSCELISDSQCCPTPWLLWASLKSLQRSHLGKFFSACEVSLLFPSGLLPVRLALPSHPGCHLLFIPVLNIGLIVCLLFPGCTSFLDHYIQSWVANTVVCW